MKNLILSPVIFLLFFFSGFSQSVNPLPNNPQNKPYSFYELKPYSLGDSTFQFKSWNDSLNQKKILLPNGELQITEIPGLNLNDILPMNNMPVFVPKGNYPMQVYVPDSTVNYTLKIKKY
ncbi:hypothetical protein [Aquiflexum gelatinilyticum]|uniref:Uncharacterized protein n=1 Tax=Aquiflexum gelatinilyticum TaxID=2961943 RepID=A0A9X2P4X0_9BACT|nr:hypothetical protein [Aquiflexum gelatinilyticum]MCR9013572.1 hypothetical protein [Aquiflexum gelatinilyticum]MCS4436860.1 hypothetical protein [Aquiflexum gelatinilyticum]